MKMFWKFVIQESECTWHYWVVYFYMVNVVNIIEYLFYHNFKKIKMGTSGTKQAMKGLHGSGRQSVKDPLTGKFQMWNQYLGQTVDWKQGN